MSIEMFLALFFTSQTPNIEPLVKEQSSPVIVQQELLLENTEYCQTVYWYPNAQELMDEAWCDLESTEREIKKAKIG